MCPALPSPTISLGQTARPLMKANWPGKMSVNPKEIRTGSFLDELLYRRVPPVLAAYLGVTWTLFELMQWLAEQYLISPYLGQAILLGLLLLSPSVLVVTYRPAPGRPHGAPYRSRARSVRERPFPRVVRRRTPVARARGRPEATSRTRRSLRSGGFLFINQRSGVTPPVHRERRSHHPGGMPVISHFRSPAAPHPMPVHSTNEPPRGRRGGQLCIRDSPACARESSPHGLPCRV